MELSNLDHILSLLLDNIAYIAIGYILLLITGLALSKYSSLVVYRNFNDFGASFVFFSLSMLAPIIALKLGITSESSLYFLFCLVLLCIYLMILIVNTFTDNKNPLFFVIAIILKLSLSLLYAITILDLIVPQGNQRRKSELKRNAFLIISVLTPVIYLLVKDKKTGIFRPRKAI